jgi:hypothetical protein
MSLFTYYDESEVETIEPVFKKRTFSDEWRAKLSAATKERIANGNHNRIGKKHSAETRAKMSAAKRGKMTGENNSRFGSSDYSWHTPLGVFTTSILAAEAEGIEPPCLRARCKHKTKFQDYFRKKLDKSANRDNVVK